MILVNSVIEQNQMEILLPKVQIKGFRDTVCLSVLDLLLMLRMMFRVNQIDHDSVRLTGAY